MFLKTFLGANPFCLNYLKKSNKTSCFTKPFWTSKAFSERRRGEGGGFRPPPIKGGGGWVQQGPSLSNPGGSSSEAWIQRLEWLTPFPPWGSAGWNWAQSGVEPGTKNKRNSKKTCPKTANYAKMLSWPKICSDQPWPTHFRPTFAHFGPSFCTSKSQKCVTVQPPK